MRHSPRFQIAAKCDDGTCRSYLAHRRDNRDTSFSPPPLLSVRRQATNYAAVSPRNRVICPGNVRYAVRSVARSNRLELHRARACGRDYTSRVPSETFFFYEHLFFSVVPSPIVRREIRALSLSSNFRIFIVVDGPFVRFFFSFFFFRFLDQSCRISTDCVAQARFPRLVFFPPSSLPGIRRTRYPCPSKFNSSIETTRYTVPNYHSAIVFVISSRADVIEPLATANMFNRTSGIVPSVPKMKRDRGRKGTETEEKITGFVASYRSPAKSTARSAEFPRGTEGNRKREERSLSRRNRS